MDSTNNDSQICVTSYNSTGFSQNKIDFMKTLMLFSDIFCLQEHFLMTSKDKKHSNTNKIRNAFGQECDMFITPAFKTNSEVSAGRAKGGLCTMWKKGLTKYVSKIETKNDRIQATMFSFTACNILVINSYFMCDPRTNFDDRELHNLLSEIRRVIEVSECQNVSLNGDLNCDFSRQTPFVGIVRQFCESMKIKPIWSNPKNDDSGIISTVSHTYCQIVENEARQSCIDHFVVNDRLYSAIVEAGAIRSVDNFSWHDPIYCKIKVGQLDLELEKEVRKPVPSWNNSSETKKENYRFELENRLNNIHIPGSVSVCRNVLCNQHDDDLNDYCETVLDAIELAAKDQLDSTKVKDEEKSAKKITPGWNEFVKPFHEEAKFWWSIWISSGRPSGCNNSLFQNMKSSKAQYKYAIRRLKGSAEQVHNNAFVSSILGGSSSIYSEVKKFRGMTKTVSSRIDDVVGSEKIANHFAEKYSDLYNKCELGAQLENLTRFINNNIRNVEDIDAISPELI